MDSDDRGARSIVIGVWTVVLFSTFILTASAQTTVQGSGKVFWRNPLVSAHTYYGATGFVENGGQDTPQLTDELVAVQFDVTLGNDGYYRLAGDYCTIVEVDTPSYGGDSTAWMQDSSDFSCTREDPLFEAVMAFYYISQSQKYIRDSVGHGMMVDARWMHEARPEMVGLWCL